MTGLSFILCSHQPHTRLYLPTLLILPFHLLLHTLHLFLLSTLFQMFEDWFSGSGSDASGLSSESFSDLGSGFSTGFTSEASFASGSGLDFGSAWGSGEVYCPCLLVKPANNKRQKYSQKSEHWTTLNVNLRQQQSIIFYQWCFYFIRTVTLVI